MKKIKKFFGMSDRKAHNTSELIANKEGKIRIEESQPKVSSDYKSITRRKLLKLGGSGTLGLGALAMLNQGTAHAASNGPIPIGSMYPLTGWAAADGAGYKRGIELACEEINDYGGILGRKLENHYVDTKDMSAAEVTAAANYLIDKHNVHAIINGYNILVSIFFHLNHVFFHIL